MKMLEIEIKRRKSNQASRNDLRNAMTVNYDEFYFTAVSIPLSELKKDFVDCIKPYKSAYHIIRDLLGEWLYSYKTWGYAFQNLMFGVLFLLASPFVAYSAVKYSELSKHDALLRAFALPLAKISVGLIQLAAAPFIMFRVLPRCALTLYYGFTKIEDSKGIQDIIKKYEVSGDEESKQLMESVLAAKIEKKLLRRESTNLDMYRLSDSKGKVLVDLLRKEKSTANTPDSLAAQSEPRAAAPPIVPLTGAEHKKANIAFGMLKSFNKFRYNSVNTNRYLLNAGVDVAYDLKEIAVGYLRRVGTR